MKLDEYTLNNFAVSDITSDSITNGGLGEAVFMNARFYRNMLQVQYEVFSSVLDARPVDKHGHATSGQNYIVSIAFGHVRQMPTTGDEVMSIIQNNDAKVNCTCPSFYWQGMWEHNHQLNGAMPSFAGTHGTGTWTARHGVGKQPQACKHIWAVYNQLSKDSQEIADALRK